MNKKMTAALLALFVAACGGAQSHPTGEASSASSSEPVNLNTVKDETTWNNIRRIIGKTPVETGLYTVGGEVGAVVQALAKKTGLDYLKYPITHIVREKSGMLYTGGADKEENINFFLVLRPSNHTGSLCIVADAKMVCVNNDDEEKVYPLPSDVVLAAENVLNTQQLIKEGEEYMKKHNIDPLAPVPVSDYQKASDVAK